MIRFEGAVRGDLDPHTSVWRYFTHDKFRALLETSAVWFSKLSRFSDGLEGHRPDIARLGLVKILPEDGTRGTTDRPVPVFSLPEELSLRELTVASCWFESDQDEQAMWDQYSDERGVAVRSSAIDLVESMQLQPSYSHIGRVSYIKFGDASASAERQLYRGYDLPFMKDIQYAGEREVRVTTLNLIAPGCLNPDGSPPDSRQRQGLTYSEGRPGILVRADLSRLFHEVRVAPRSPLGFEDEVARWMSESDVVLRATRSAGSADRSA